MDDPLGATQGEIAQLIRIAGQIGIYLAQARARALDDERRADRMTEHALSEQLHAEVRSGRAFYANVDREQWWEMADQRDVANAYGFAKRFAAGDPQAASAVATIEREVFDRWEIDLHAQGNIDFSAVNVGEVAAPVLESDAASHEALRGMVDDALSALEREQEAMLVQAQEVEAKEVSEAKEALAAADTLPQEHVQTKVREAQEAVATTDTLQAHHEWTRQQTLAGANPQAVHAVATASKMHPAPLSGAILTGAGTSKAKPSFKPPAPVQSAARQR